MKWIAAICLSTMLLGGCVTVRNERIPNLSLLTPAQLELLIKQAQKTPPGSPERKWLIKLEKQYEKQEIQKTT